MALRLGSRGSPLAMAQSYLVQEMLANAANESVDAFPIVKFTTTGDRIQDQRLQNIGGKGLFTKELDEALADNRIDAAVHSMKDLPTKLPEGQVLACVPSREDPRDAFVSLKSPTLMALRPGSTIGTASLRRQAQTLNIRPDLRVVTLRGSVHTRLKRLGEGDIDGTFLALAGLTRLGLASVASSIMSSKLMPPAPGQGAIAVTCRADDHATRNTLAGLSVARFEIATSAERAFLDALDGSCRTPIGAFATVEGDTLSFVCEVLSPDGVSRWRRKATIFLDSNPHAKADALGRELGREVRAEAGARFQVAPLTAW